MDYQLVFPRAHTKIDFAGVLVYAEFYITFGYACCFVYGSLQILPVEAINLVAVWAPGWISLRRSDLGYWAHDFLVSLGRYWYYTSPKAQKLCLFVFFRSVVRLKKIRCVWNLVILNLSFWL